MGNDGHHWIWNPPAGSLKRNMFQQNVYTYSIDLPRLGIYVGVTVAICLFAAFIIFKIPRR